MPQQRAGVLSAAATVHVGEYAGLCLFLPGMMPSAPPVYPLDAIPLETVDRSSDALQLHELASAWTVCQTAARCFVVLLFANGITHIENVIEPEIKQIESVISTLKDARASLLAKLKDARSVISQSRSVFVEELNARLGGEVLLDLCGHNATLFYDAVNSPLQGSGMQRREDQLSLACEGFAPEEFVEIIRMASID